MWERPTDGRQRISSYEKPSGVGTEKKRLEQQKGRRQRMTLLPLGECQGRGTCLESGVDAFIYQKEGVVSEGYWRYFPSERGGGEKCSLRAVVQRKTRNRGRFETLLISRGEEPRGVDHCRGGLREKRISRSPSRGPPGGGQYSADSSLLARTFIGVEARGETALAGKVERRSRSLAPNSPGGETLTFAAGRERTSPRIESVFLKCVGKSRLFPSYQ